MDLTDAKATGQQIPTAVHPKKKFDIINSFFKNSISERTEYFQGTVPQDI